VLLFWLIPYTEENMLDFEQEEENLTRRYKRAETLERILLIKKLKEDGLSIPQIKESIIDMKGVSHIPQVFNGM
jgi:DNA-binding transcriptional MerR regulator